MNNCMYVVFKYVTVLIKKVPYTKMANVNSHFMIHVLVVHA